MFEGWTSPFAETQRQASDRDAAWNALRNDPGAAALLAGLSMLANNNGQHSFGQLMGQAGVDALNGANALAAEQRARQRQLLLARDRATRGQAGTNPRPPLRGQPPAAGPSGAQRPAVSAAGQDTGPRAAAQDTGTLTATDSALRPPSGPYQPHSPYLPDGQNPAGGEAPASAASAATGGAQPQDVQARLNAILQDIQALQASLAGGASARGVQPLSGAL